VRLNPCDRGSDKTSVIENLNNKWRNRISGLVRKPLVAGDGKA
jgi:DMSO/TMAO reductase YedYZ molybdopterin-dependent catalytic subunit